MTASSTDYDYLSLGNTYVAIPCDCSAPCFYFGDYETYLEKAEANRNEAGETVEFYDIEFVDGDAGPLFNTLNVDQANLELWFEVFERFDEVGRIKARFLAQITCLAMADIPNMLSRLEIAGFDVSGRPCILVPDELVPESL